MRVKLTKAQRIRVLNSVDVYKVMQHTLLRENKIGASWGQVGTSWGTSWSNFFNFLGSPIYGLLPKPNIVTLNEVKGLPSRCKCEILRYAQNDILGIK